MNDATFIIISSDEETNANDNSKTQAVSNIIKENVEQGTDFLKKQYIPKSPKQEEAQCSHMPVSDGGDISSKSCNLYAAKELHNAQINSLLEKDYEYYKEHTRVKTEIEPKSNTNIKDDNHVEMSDTFNKFLQLVLSMEEKEDDKAKLLKKIIKYHNLADPKYLRSDEFNNLLESSMSKLIKDQAFLYFIIKEVLDCLLSKRALTDCTKNEKVKSSSTGDATKMEKCEKDPDKKVIDPLSDGDEKNYTTIKKLTKVLRKLEKKIKELEEAEVDLSDEEDSIYLKMQRYRERYCLIYNKLCACTKQTATKLACTRKISFNGTNNLQLDRSIETWLNKTVQFPDYASVLKFLRESNDNLHLGMSEEKIKKLAVDTFVKIGNSLQLRRKYDLWDSLNSLLDNKVDPSTSDAGLRERLDANFEIAVKKEKEILNYYADLQTSRSLQPVEVPDEEANVSPVESGDEDENELEAVENELSKIPIEVEGSGEERDDEINDQESCNSPVLSDNEVVNANSNESEYSPKLERVRNCLDQDKNEESSKHAFRSCAISTSCIDPAKKHNCEYGENSDITVFEAKALPEIENGKCLKKAKITRPEGCDDDSACELVVLLSDEEESFNSEKECSSNVRKMHQINYAFIKNNFNHNATLTADDLVLKRKNTSFSFKSGKTQRRYLQLPLSDLTNIKHITNKYAQYRSGLEKRKVQESIRLHPFERSRFRYSQIVLPGKMSNHSTLQNNSCGKNAKSQIQSEQINAKDTLEQSSDKRGIGSPKNRVSTGGNGEDYKNGEYKTPLDQEKRINHNQAKEDDKEEYEEDKEACSRYQSFETTSEINGNNAVTSQPTNGNSETPTKRVPVTSCPELQSNRVAQPQSKNKSDTPKAKRMSSNKAMWVHKNGGSPSTSRIVSVKYQFSCKPYEPYVGNVKTARSRPRQMLPLSLSEIDQRRHKKQATSVKVAKSDEEIVKNFLQHSPSSISITSPRKRVVENKPSPSVLQAIQTLSRLKGITTTVVKASYPAREEDVMVLEESSRNTEKRNSKPPSPMSRLNHTVLLPKIVTVQGNVSGFENMDSDVAIPNLPDVKTPYPSRRRIYHSQLRVSAESPGNSNDNPRQIKLKRQSSTNVEQVVLD